ALGRRSQFRRRRDGAIKGAGATPWCYRSACRSPPSRPPSRRGEGGFLRDREIYYDARRDDGLATAKWREPTRSDRLPVHRSESPTGYSSAGCSPAEPASASPVTDIVVQSRSSAAIK